MDKMPKSVVLAFLIIITGMIVLFVNIINDRRQDYAENSHTLVTNCIISVPTKIRTIDHIKDCYDRVERDTGLKLNRYYYEQ